jgi:DNA-binding response OmpR family regulator
MGIEQSRLTTILVVEDEGLLRGLIVEKLAGAGFRVLEAHSGESALAFAASRHGIDLVLTDICLGGELNGWDVAESFRAAFAEMPIIYVSGLSIEPRREVLGSMFFEKPYDPERILAACRALTARAL